MTYWCVVAAYGIYGVTINDVIVWRHETVNNDVIGDDDVTDFCVNNAAQKDEMLVKGTKNLLTRRSTDRFSLKGPTEMTSQTQRDDVT